VVGYLAKARCPLQLDVDYGDAPRAVSDGVEARVGTLSEGRECFKPWRTIAGETLAGAHLPELQVVIEGLCAPLARRCCDGRALRGDRRRQFGMWRGQGRMHGVRGMTC